MSSLDAALATMASCSGCKVAIMFRVPAVGPQEVVGSLLLGSQCGFDRPGDMFKPQVFVDTNLKRYSRDIILTSTPDPYITVSEALARGIGSVVMFRYDTEGEPLVVVVGFEKDSASIIDPTKLGELASGCVLAFRKRWPISYQATLSQLLHEISYDLDLVPDFNGFLDRLAQRLHRSLNGFQSEAHTSIWLANTHRKELYCKHVFVGEGTGNEAGRVPGGERPFNQGITGWVAENAHRIDNLVVNFLPYKKEDPSGPSEIVPPNQYEPWLIIPNRGDCTKSELAIPLVHHRRLVGVLNFERPVEELYSDEFVATARILASHVAHAIHLREIDEFYRRILKVKSLDELAKTIVDEASKFIEAHFATVFIWSETEQALLLKQSSGKVQDDSNQDIPVGTGCYTEPEIGLTRWAFDFGLRLNLVDGDSLRDPRSDRGRAQLTLIAEQLRAQLAMKANPIISADQINIELYEPNDEMRSYWHITNKNNKNDEKKIAGVPEKLPCPIWSGRQFEGTRNEEMQSVLVVPIPNIRSVQDTSDDSVAIHRPALGVMRFVRQKVEIHFTDFEVELLEGIAFQCARVLEHEQFIQARARARVELLKIAQSGRGNWREGFQRRLNELLEQVQEKLHADVVIIRTLYNGVLTLEASSPAQSKLTNRPIPRQTRVGSGGSGAAAAKRCPICLVSRDDPILVAIREELKGRPEFDFANVIESEVAIPILEGNEVVGTITAVSFRVSKQTVKMENDRWVTERSGLVRHAQHLLLYQADWLGLAIQTIREMVAREREISSFSTAIAMIEESGPRGLDHLERAALIVATHHHGLRFHQAFIAELISDPGSKPYRIGGSFNRAWGAIDADEQNEARARFGELEADIKMPAKEPNACLPIRKAWKLFAFDLDELPQEPSIVVRKAFKSTSGACLDASPTGNDERNVSRGKVRYLVADGEPASNQWERLLDRFCAVFGIAPTSEAGQQIQLGMVPLWASVHESNVPVVFFVTNLTFLNHQIPQQNSQTTPSTQNPDSPSGLQPPLQLRLAEAEEFTGEDLQALADIGRVLRWPYQRDSLARAQEIDREFFRGSIHRMMEPLQALEVIVHQLQLQAKNRDRDTAQEIGMRAFDLVWEQMTKYYQLSTLRSNKNNGGQGGFTRESVDFAQLVQDVINVHSKWFEDCGYVFEYNTSPESLTNVQVLGNKTYLASVLFTLLSNASKALDEIVEDKKWIRASLEIVEKRYVQFSISDNGIPFPVNFIPGKKVEVSRLRGMGMGLVLAQEALREHSPEGGLFIRADNENSKVIGFKLPIEGR